MCGCPTSGHLGGCVEKRKGVVLLYVTLLSLLLAHVEFTTLPAFGLDRKWDLLSRYLYRSEFPPFRALVIDGDYRDLLVKFVIKLAKYAQIPGLSPDHRKGGAIPLETGRLLSNEDASSYLLKEVPKWSELELDHSKMKERWAAAKELAEQQASKEAEDRAAAEAEFRELESGTDESYQEWLKNLDPIFKPP